MFPARRAACAALGAIALPACTPVRKVQAPATLESLLASPHRTPRNAARDPHRHPLETIRFFGLRDDSRVVEILPGSAGYYLEILAPWLRERGLYVAAGRDESAPPAYLADHRRMLERLAADPQRYDRVRVTRFDADRHEIAPAGSMDAVLTFRNLHNWMARDETGAVLRAFHRALKPGGVLGVVEHRAAANATAEQVKDSGYMTEEMVIKAAEAAGFVLEAKSEINANPRDTRDHPKGVWTLPPSLALGDTDREKYVAIGESDRMTLRFRKPAQ